jgi:solute carrier family 25 protein 39/40
MVESERSQNPWMNTMDGYDSAVVLETTVEDREGLGLGAPQAQPSSNSSSDGNLGIAERAVSAAGAAFLSAIIVNPLDVVKVKIQQIKRISMCVCVCV